MIGIAEDQAEVACQVLRAESSEDFTDLAERVFDPTPSDAQADSVNPWRVLTVLAVVVAAGAVIVLDSVAGAPAARRGGLRLAGAPREGVEPLDRLATAVGAGVTLKSAPERGQPRRRLRYLPEASAWELATDADRDGRYESHRRFAVTLAP